MSQSISATESVEQMTHGASASEMLRVAIVGCGPKGIYCLERLAEQLRRVPNAIQIVIYEPSRFPGAGPIYDPRQPTFLRMNFASRHVTAWAESDGCSVPQDRPTLVQWLEQNHPALCDPDAYIPRAIVGEYLHWCFQQIVGDFDGMGVLRTIPRKATSIERDGSRWQISAGSSKESFEEVLITVGHEGWRAAPTGIKAGVAQPDSSHYINPVFPVSRQLSHRQVQSQSKIAIRGFSLTFIDVALALTEGRGGEFFRRDARWYYNPSGLEPRKIIPFSRTGRPMLAKPDPQKCLILPGIDEVWTTGREKLRSLDRGPGQIDYTAAVWPVLVETAAKALGWSKARNGSQRYCPDQIADWFQQWSSHQFDESAAVQRIERSYQTAIGQRPPDEAWALGEMWRQLYPVLVDLVSHGGLTQKSWETFRLHTVEMERIAFGPPPENAGRMLALMQTGLIDLRFLPSPDVIQRGSKFHLRHDGQQTEVDSLINAVIPASHEFAEDSLFRPLIEAGSLTQCEVTGGIKVDRRARPISDHGSAAGGLAVLGRVTEGWILGNDTLSQKLHPHPGQWAEMVARCSIRKGANR